MEPGDEANSEFHERTDRLVSSRTGAENKIPARAGDSSRIRSRNPQTKRKTIGLAVGVETRFTRPAAVASREINSLFSRGSWIS
jgi:hypothetical protein